jgi:predicted AlkP superfamily phosphohydrolase/phosphomutase
VLGVDAADAGLVRQWADAGELPTFARLFRDAAHVATEAPAGLFVGATWVDATSGVDANRHRYYTWLAHTDDYQLRPTSPLEARCEPMWRELSRQGLRSAVFDVPHHRPDAQHLGIEVYEWGCHDRHHGPASQPPELLRELDARFGSHYGSGPAPGFDQHAPCDYLHRAAWLRTDAEERALLTAILDGQARKAQASLDLLGREPWDLYFAVLGESHCTGHNLWHVHDPHHPRHDPRQRARLGDPLLAVYRAIDTTLAAHLDAVGADTVVYVVAAHGMAAHYGGNHLLDVVLDRIDRNGSSGVARPGWRSRMGAPVWSAMGSRGRSFSAALLRRRARTAPPQPLADVPNYEGMLTGPRATRSGFVVPNNDVTGAVRANLVGRESCGVLFPGAELDAWCTRVADVLKSLVNIDTGGPVVRDVWRADDRWTRTADDGLPDLFVEWERSVPIERVYSPMVGAVDVPYVHFRTGDHVVGGHVWALGRGLEPSEVSGRVPIAALAPTVAASLGIELPHADANPVPALVPRLDPAVVG